jgi:hypothetical protein
MRIAFILMAHVLSRLIHLMETGGAKFVLAENLLLKHQLLVLKRKRLRAPRLTPGDRLLLGLGACFLHPRRPRRMAIIPSPATEPSAFTRLARGTSESRIFRSRISRSAIGPPRRSRVAT